MAEPTKLYRNGEELTAYGAAQIAVLLAEGWQREALHVTDDYGDEIIMSAMDEAPAATTTSTARAQYGAQVGTAQVVDKRKIREVAKAKAKDKRDAASL